MALKIYYQEDCGVPVLKGYKVAIIGYDSQDHTHALNLKDSGVDVCVGLYGGPKSREEAEKQGFTVKTNAEVTKWANITMILISDKLQADMHKKDIESNLNEGDMLVFTHGFNIHSGPITPSRLAGITMIALEAPGHMAHNESLDGKGVPMLIVVEQDAMGKVLEKAPIYDAAISGARVDPLETTYHIETETDLFDEQAVLRGGVCTPMQADFDTLVEASYDPGNVYFECIYEMKLIADLTYQSGSEGMRYSISSTAEFGDYVSDPKPITDETRKAAKKILLGIQDGTSADQFLLGTNPVGRQAHLKAIRRKTPEHLSGSVGKEIRKLHSWSNKDSELINN